MERESAAEERKRARINFRPLLFCALGLCFGIFLFFKIRFGGFAPSDLIFLVLFAVFALFPISKRRAAALVAALIVFAGAGCLSAFCYAERNLDVLPAGEYRVAGTVLSVAEKRGYSVVTLDGLSFDGTGQGGSLRLTLSSPGVRVGDLLLFDAAVEPVSFEDLSENSFTRSLFAAGVRYTASASSFECTGRTKNPFLMLDAAIRDTLNGMGGEEADVGYALLTGNSAAIEEGLSDVMRRGGIAHIFAVSGLHIGILYAAVLFLFRPLGRYRFLPALAAAVCYAALCGFPVSAVRAVLMCGALGVNRFFGRKTDFLNSISFAALCVLIVSPAQWLSAGFRLSFGACLGLALFSGSLSRLLAKLRLPRAVRGYLGASLSVQLFLFPVLLEEFGYFSVWGTALNLVVVPVMPAIFLCLLVSTLSALIIPPAAGFFLIFPSGLLSLLVGLFSAADFSFALAGFSLGAGATVWIVGSVALSERFRLKAAPRAVAMGVFSALFALCLVFSNVPSGCVVDTYRREDAAAVLLRTEEGARVLVIDGDMRLTDCEDFLARNYGGKLTAVVVLAERETRTANVAAFLDAETVRLRERAETGLRNTQIVYGDFTCGELSFRFAGAQKLLCFYEGTSVEIDFEGSEGFGTDLFLGGARGGSGYRLKDGHVFLLRE